MKFFNNIFSVVYLFFEAMDDGRPENEDTSIIGAIFVFTILLSSNLLSFFSANYLKEIKWFYYFIGILTCSILIIYYNRKKRYLKLVKEFSGVKNKEIYYGITIAYVILSLVIFMRTR